MKSFITQMGLVASCALPLFNIPMILRMVRRKSSQDLSFTWLLGVWVCILLMFPSTWISADPIFKLFGVMNLVFFTAVVAVAMKYRRPE